MKLSRTPQVLLATAIAASLLLPGCSEEGSPPSPAGEKISNAGKPVVYTTFYPTAYFTERIAGDLVEVVCPVPEEADAIFWKPDAEMIQRYQQADLVVLNGADFAKWVAQVSLPENRLVDTAKPFESEFVRFETATKHSHGEEGEHTHEGIDGHTWVDPLNAKVQAGEIRKALEERYPEHSEAFRQGESALARDLDALDAELKKLDASPPLFASHPAYNYLIKRYGWNLQNLDLDPEQMPDDETFAAIRTMQARHPAKLLLWEGEPRPEIARRFADDLGLASVVFSPCELLGGEERESGADYLSIMKGNVMRLKEALR